MAKTPAKKPARKPVPKKPAPAPIAAPASSTTGQLVPGVKLGNGYREGRNYAFYLPETLWPALIESGIKAFKPVPRDEGIASFKGVLCDGEDTLAIQFKLRDKTLGVNLNNILRVYVEGERRKLGDAFLDANEFGMTPTNGLWYEASSTFVLLHPSQIFELKRRKR